MFSWRKGYSYKVSAETVGIALEQIEEKEGHVTSKGFLEYSRPEDSPTHSMFEWDDSVAAEKYRLNQSAKIINQLEVKIVCEQSGEDSSIKAFVNVEPKKPLAVAAWVNVEKARGDEDMWQNVLKNALGELRAFKNKYARFEAFSGVFREIEKLEEIEKLA